MEWATNAAGDHIQAGTPNAYGYPLRCPVCKAAVYHRNGIYNRPHFAHYSGNSNRACELYDPRKSAHGGFSDSRPRFPEAPSFGVPVLIWLDRELASLSLQLRLPMFPNGYASKLTFTMPNGYGTRTLAGEQLTHQRFVSLPLGEPPARVKTNPLDLETEVRIEEALSQFRLSGNYFRSMSSGGVLEVQETPLELGEEYFYISQRALQGPYPAALKVHGQKVHRSWWAYRVLLLDTPDSRDEDIADLRSYLGKSVVPPKPRVEIIWPPPQRFDADGTAVYIETTRQLIIRSDAGPPNVRTGSESEAGINHLSGLFYQVTLGACEKEAIVWVHGSTVRRLRFTSASFAKPGGVVLTTPTLSSNIVSPMAEEIAGQRAPIEITVPSALLWRNANFNGRRLNPLPNGETYITDGPLGEASFGAFGSIRTPLQAADDGIERSTWHTKIEKLVAASIGPSALQSMKSIHSKAQLVRWAFENNAQQLLPLVLSAFSSEVTCDFPRD